MSSPKNTVADFMRSARHLSPSAVARVVNGHTSGIDWRGCSKGHIAEALATRPEQGGISDRLLFELRCTRAVTSVGRRDSDEVRLGGYGVTEADRAKLQAYADESEARISAARVGGPIAWAAGETRRRMREVLDWLDTQSSEPRVAALARLRQRLAREPKLLADLNLVTS